MVFSSRQHVHDTRASPLLAELHLEDSIVYGLATDLVRKHIELAVGDFEIRGGIFVLHRFGE